MKTSNSKYDETRLAEEIVSVLPAEGMVRVCSEDRDSVRFSIRAADLRLCSVVLSRASLERLLTDATRSAKIEYLQRELLAVAAQRSEFRYPRGSHGHAPGPATTSLPQVSAR